MEIFRKNQSLKRNEPTMVRGALLRAQGFRNSTRRNKEQKFFRITTRNSSTTPNSSARTKRSVTAVAKAAHRAATVDASATLAQVGRPVGLAKFPGIEGTRTTGVSQGIRERNGVRLQT